jgi:hypothetical protein
LLTFPVAARKTAAATTIARGTSVANTRSQGATELASLFEKGLP